MGEPSIFTRGRLYKHLWEEPVSWFLGGEKTEHKVWVKKTTPILTLFNPIEGVTRTVYLKNIITNPQIIIGDYTYYDDSDDAYNFEKNVFYLFNFMGDKIIIDKFRQIATGVRFIMNRSNHNIYEHRVIMH